MWMLPSCYPITQLRKKIRPREPGKKPGLGELLIGLNPPPARRYPTRRKEKKMTLPLVLGVLLVGAVIVAAARQYVAGHNKNGRIELGVKQPSKPHCDCL